MSSMKTEVFKIDDCVVDSDRILQAAKIVECGGLVVFPTETVYGIASLATGDALARLDDTKSRKSDKRYSLHIGRKETVSDYVPSMSLRAEKLVNAFCPGR